MDNMPANIILSYIQKKVNRLNKMRGISTSQCIMSGGGRRT